MPSHQRPLAWPPSDRTSDRIFFYMLDLQFLYKWLSFPILTCIFSKMNEFSLHRVALARENAAYLSSPKGIHDALHAGIRSNREEEEPREDDDDVEGDPTAVAGGVSRPADLVVCAAHAKEGDTPEDEAEPAVEQPAVERRAHVGEDSTRTSQGPRSHRRGRGMTDTAGARLTRT